MCHSAVHEARSLQKVEKRNLLRIVVGKKSKKYEDLPTSEGFLKEPQQ